MIKTNICIIGAGIIGLSLAYELIQNGHKDILILDKEPQSGVHASGRNSGVLHAGIYYKSDSLKAKFCLKGNKLWRQFCFDHNIPILDTGKVIVAKNESEKETLNQLYHLASHNGARVRLIDSKELHKIEPLAKTTDIALMSYDTAIINSKLIMSIIEQKLNDSKQVNILYNQKVAQVEPNIVVTQTTKIKYQLLINCAGSYSDKLAHQCGVDKKYRLIPFKGIYKKLIPKYNNLIHSNIYPVPDLRNPFLGIHFTKSMSKEIYVGPTAIPAFGAEHYGFFKGIDQDSLRIFMSDALLFFKNNKFRSVALSEPKNYIPYYFYKEAKKLVKSLHYSDIVASSKVGIRPQLVNWDTKELVMDFLIEKKDNTIHILNAISPAFTSAPAFVKEIISKYIN
ncbi:L-2-hydroxyglutarate oxidase [Candidatus Marinamargulisbacteria bacterium SCGC AG-410-N11]|nr:L-2-hydroxyglutarate oxidase [Candidatus Marinamargulisbacteria bacterium SCGC AG-410-N11]